MFLSDNGACPEPYRELGGGTMADINDSDKSGSVSYGMGWANASNTPYRKWKTELEEGGMATPLIVHWPGGINKANQNTINHSPSYLIDIMPTLVEVSNATYPQTFAQQAIHPLTGRSIIPALYGNKLKSHDYMFWEHQDNQAIRKGNWKAVKDGKKGDWLLFDLSKDRMETKNISAQRPEVLKELVTKWEEWATGNFVLPKRKS